MTREEVFKEYKIKVTKPREAIYDVIKNATHALDAESIKEETKKTGLYINLSTVYRTLDLFVSLGIIEKFDLGDNKYNYLLRKHHHVHEITCEICHKNLELECPMTKIQELITKETGFTILEHNLELKGICKDCKEKLSKDDIDEITK